MMTCSGQLQRSLGACLMGSKILFAVDAFSSGKKKETGRTGVSCPRGSNVLVLSVLVELLSGEGDTDQLHLLDEKVSKISRCGTLFFTPPPSDVG